MTAKKCFKNHQTKGICSTEIFVLFHGTKYRVALSAHEFICDKCNKIRRIYFIS